MSGAGISSETLLDKLGRPVRDLRISVTDRCNFRCVYCMPKEVFGPGYQFLKMKSLLSYEEMERLARIFAGLGVTKLRLTGGEPLVRRHIERLIRMLAEIPNLDLALTTNGSLLTDKAQPLADAGLKRITVSLDSLDDEDAGAWRAGSHQGAAARHRAGAHAPIVESAALALSYTGT